MYNTIWQKILFGMAMFAVIPAAIAQNVEIKGRVLNEKEQPLPYATIVVEEKKTGKPVKALACGTSGNFSVMLSPNAQLMLKISHIGYQSTAIPVTTDSLKVVLLSDIILVKAKFQIKEVVIKPLVEVTSTEIIYNITSDPERATSNMLQIIGKVPMIRTDEEGTITIGNTTENKYVVTRNGRIDALFNTGGITLDELLKRLPAMGFSQIRIVKNPSKRFGNIMYQVDIVTDKSSSTIGAISSSDISYNIQSGLLKSAPHIIASPAESFRLSAGVGFSNTNAPDVRTRKVAYYSKTDSTLETSALNIKSSEEYSGNISFSYDVGKRSFLYSSLNLSLTQENFRTRSQSLWSKNELANRSREINFSQPGISKSLNYLGTYEKSLNDKFATFYLSCLLNAAPKSVNSNRVTLSKPGEYSFQKREFEENTTNTVVTTGMYDRKEKFSYGTNVTFSQQYFYSEEMLTGSKSDITATSIKKKEQKLEGVVSGSYSFTRKLSVNSSLRTSTMLNGGSISKRTGSTTEQIAQNGNTFQNNVTVRYATSEDPNNDIMLNYQIAMNSPNIQQQAQSNNGSNPDYISQGNLNLKPEIYHTISGTYGMTSLISTFSGNKIGSYTSLNADNQVITNTWTNGEKYYDLRIATFLPNVLIYKIRFIIEPSLGYTYSKNIGNEVSRSLNWSAIVRFSMPVYKNIRCSFWGYYSDNISSKYSGYRSRMPIAATFNLSYKHSLSNRQTWQINMGCNILGWIKGSVQEVNTSSFTLKQSTISKSIPLYFSIKYSFGNFKVRPVKSGAKSAIVSGYSNYQNENNKE